MIFFRQPQILELLGGVIGFLLLATIVGQILSWRTAGTRQAVAVDNLVQRVNAWWSMIFIFVIMLVTGDIGRCILFGLISFLALREFVTLTPVGMRDHAPLVWTFFIITPIQYILVGAQVTTLYPIFIPVYGFLFVTIRMALVGEERDFLVRGAVVQMALMVCVYCVSYSAAIGSLSIPNDPYGGDKLLIFLVFVTQISDVFQYIVGKLFGRHKVAPKITPNKTWEGLFGGLVVGTASGAALSWITPFPLWQAALFAFLIAVLGFLGGLTMSLIKRDRGVKDFGAIIPGHGGVLDRIDSLIFAAPIFFQLDQHFYASVPQIIKVVHLLP